MRRRTYGEYYLPMRRGHFANSSTKFDQVIQIAPVQSARGPSEKINLKKKFPGTETFSGENAENTNNFLNSFVGFFKPAIL